MSAFTFSVGEVLGEDVRCCGARFGHLNDQLRGFYRALRRRDGATYLIATTPDGVDRRPPGVSRAGTSPTQATFEITLVVDNDLAVLLLSPDAEVTDLGDGTRRIRYEPNG